MGKVCLILVSLFAIETLGAAQSIAQSRFTEPLKDWQFQKMCRPASDGLQILNLLSTGQLAEDQVLIRLVNAQKKFPPFLIAEKKCRGKVKDAQL